MKKQLEASQAEAAKQKARVDRTLKVAQTKLGEAKVVHDKQHAQLVGTVSELKVSFLCVCVCVCAQVC